MIYMTLKKWDRASHFLEIVICAPAPNSLSKIMVEAYKKWILVSLISKGEVRLFTVSLLSINHPDATNSKVYITEDNEFVFCISKAI